jgi:two-component system chemotaxis response regulator CheB
MSGGLNDGTAGLHAIKECGGFTIVQDPSDCMQPDMPRSAIDHVGPDHVVPAREIPGLLQQLMAEPRGPDVEVPEEIRMEALIAAQELTTMPDENTFGKLSPLSCPDCHGVMYEIQDGSLVRYRCHTGHAFTLESAHAAAADTWEKALYEAMRVQQEQVILMKAMAEKERRHGRSHWVRTYEQRERSYQEGVEIIRQMLANGEDEPSPAGSPPEGRGAAAQEE